MIKVLKQPNFENDSYLIRFEDFTISDEKLEALLKSDKYLLMKFEKFRNQDISKNGFEDFKDRPSLRSIDSLDNLEGSVYTHKVGKENSKTYDQIITDIQYTFIKHPKTRRLMLRVANDFEEYNNSIEGGLDVSCLNLIHYLNKESKLIFRSSDVLNELYVDMVTIYEFFLRPVYKTPISIEVFASTAQNIDNFSDKIKIMEKKFYE